MLVNLTIGVGIHKTNYEILMIIMGLHTSKKCLNTNIYSYLETSGSQSFDLYLNVIHFFFNTNVNQTSVAAKDSCFPALMSNMCCSIWAWVPYYQSDMLFLRTFL
jgi:hypothetical protein